MFPKNLFSLSLGTAHFGSAIPRDASFDILDAYLDHGGNFLDTAIIYAGGASEKIIGDWMKLRGNRSRVAISTKGGHPSFVDWHKRINEADIREDIENSLRSLQTDYVEVYFLHRDDEAKPVDEIMPILDKLVKEGKVISLGASNWTVKRINEANAFAKKNGMAQFEVSQIFWNGAVINKEGVYDKTLVAMDDIEHAGYAENHMPVMAYTAQAQGLFSHIRDKGYDGLSKGLVDTYINPATKERAERILAVSAETGVSPTAVSLAYLLKDREVEAYPILGISRPERLYEALGVLTLSEESINKLFDQE